MFVNADGFLLPIGMQLQEVGDFGDENCLTPRLVPPLRDNLTRSMTCSAFAGKLHLPAGRQV